jgi:hypothetical protein
MARVLQVEKSIVCRHGVDGRLDEGRRRGCFFLAANIFRITNGSQRVNLLVGQLCLLSHFRISLIPLIFLCEVLVCHVNLDV